MGINDWYFMLYESTKSIHRIQCSRVTNILKEKNQNTRLFEARFDIQVEDYPYIIYLRILQSIPARYLSKYIYIS